MWEIGWVKFAVSMMVYLDSRAAPDVRRLIRREGMQPRVASSG